MRIKAKRPASPPGAFRVNTSGLDQSATDPQDDRVGIEDVTHLPKVEIHVTELCNNRCTFCTTGWVNLERADMQHPPRELIRAQLETAYAGGARRALFQGGEPTLRRDLGDLVADAKSIGYLKTTIFTNARMGASKAGARWLVGMGVDWFQVSVQGGTAAAHDASVAAPGAFAQTVAGIRRLVELGQHVKVNAVLTSHLVESISAFAQLMVELGPNEVGLDTIKPSSAFGDSRESYGRLLLRLSEHGPALRDAVLAMNAAGVLARLTSFPPCLVPGAEAYVAEETERVQVGTTSGTMKDKFAWKRSMQVKAPGCATCAYDSTCGGVYAPYADLYGLDELQPIATRAEAAPIAAPRDVDTALTLALRSLFVRERPGAARGVMGVMRSAGVHVLSCFGPDGAILVSLGPLAEGPAYARTARFCVGYRKPASGIVDRVLLDAVVDALRRTELALPVSA